MSIKKGVGERNIRSLFRKFLIVKLFFESYGKLIYFKVGRSCKM